VRRSARAFISRLLECSRPSRSASDAASRRRSSSAMVGDDGLGGDMLLYGRVRGRRRQTAPHPRQLGADGAAGSADSRPTHHGWPTVPTDGEWNDGHPDRHRCQVASG
jgi:hypothetical protein